MPASFRSFPVLLTLLLMLWMASDASVMPIVQDGPDEPDGGAYHSYQVPFDRNMAVACTNRYNCERSCQRALVAKQASKAALLDALTRTIGDSPLTDAHKLGIQLGRHKSCDRCPLIYSNCGDQWYTMARRQLSTWRFELDSATPDSPNRL